MSYICILIVDLDHLEKGWNEELGMIHLHAPARIEEFSIVALYCLA